MCIRDSSYTVKSLVTGTVLTADFELGDSIEKGDILLTTDVGELPQVPEHHTVIDVRLGLGQHSFPIGTVVELRSTQACADDARASPEGCVVSSHAVVMAQPRLDDTGSTVTQMAMSAVEALQVLAAQEHGTLIAARGAS